MQEKTRLECPRCGCRGRAVIQHYVDAHADSRARRNVLAGKLNFFRCRECGFHGNVPADVMYHDPEKEFCVQYVPPWRARNKEFLKSLDNKARPVVVEGDSGDEAPGYLGDVHIVFSVDELARYVIFRERLWRQKANGRNGRVFCFSCGCSIDNSVRYYCISRTLRERGDGDRGRDRILEATSSLQVCAECRIKARTRRIEFPQAQLPMLNLERDGFYRFAAQGCGRHSSRSETPETGPCNLCHAPIARGDRYTIVGLSEEVSTPKCIETVKVHALLATICDRCSHEYMVWL